jgi:hypothetical protein
MVVEVEDEPERDDGDQRTRDHADRRCMASQRSRRLAAAVGDREHRHSGSEGVRERQQNRSHPDLVLCGDDADRREHRSGAGDEHEPERGAEDESTADVVRTQPRESVERALDEQRHPWDEERRRGQEEQCDREVAEEVLRQPELGEDPGRKQREHREAGDEPGDDAEGMTPGRSAREQDRQHREHAGRDRRDDARDESDAE